MVQQEERAGRKHRCDLLDGPNYFGKFIKERRRQLGRTQKEIQLITGMDQTQVARYESGNLRGHNMRLETAYRLSLALSVELTELAKYASKDKHIEEEKRKSNARPLPISTT